MGIARVGISFEDFVSLFTTGTMVKMKTTLGIPKDAEVLNGGYDENAQRFFVDFSHPSFKDFADYSLLVLAFEISEEQFNPHKADKE